VFEEATTAIITGAAGNIVAYILNGRVDALRAWVSKIFRNGTEEQRSAPLRALAEDSNALVLGTTSELDVRTRWTILLTSLLTAHPEVLGDVDAMAARPNPTGTINIGSQHNHGSGTFIAGDYYGDGNLRPRGGSQ
jgi:hypothetical protein